MLDVEGTMLTLYRRHTAKCKKALSLPPRVLRAYMDCECPIWIYGRTETGLIPRQTTGTNALAVAQAVRDAEYRKGENETAHGPRLDESIEKFIAGRRSRIGDATTRHYKAELERFRDYCARRGVYHMRGLTTDLLEDFKVEGLPATMKDSTKQTVTRKIHCFVAEAFRRDWINLDLAGKMTPHHAQYEQKEPYSDKEIELILAEAERLNHAKEGYAKKPKTFRLLVELMLETGMRVSDAIMFDPSAVYHGASGMWVYPHVQIKRKKTHRPITVEAYLTDRLKTAIEKCDWLSPAKPFLYGKASRYEIGKQVWNRMQTIGERCGVADCRPHRLRDTFAVRALLRGIAIGDVSRLLGHSSVTTTEAYYAKWIPARGARLESIVAKSLMDA
jgi:integrase/recombinase XerD